MGGPFETMEFVNVEYSNRMLTSEEVRDRYELYLENSEYKDIPFQKKRKEEYENKMKNEYGFR